MAFTVISLAAGLNVQDHARALETAPEFAESDTDYRTLLADTGWDVMDWIDLTIEYRDSCVRQIDADTANQAELAELFGVEEAEQRLANWRAKLTAIQDGLYVRELFVCRPQGADDTSGKSDREQ